MISEASLSVMRRIARPGRMPSGRPSMSPALAWRQRLPVSAEASVGLPATVTGVEEGACGREDILSSWKPQDLHMLLRTGGTVSGLVTVSETLLAALVEVSIRGAVLRAPLAERIPTDIDAALVAPVLTRWIADQKVTLAEAGFGPLSPAMEVRERLPDPRSAALKLEAGELSFERVTLDLGEGARTGDFTVYTAEDAGGREEADADPVNRPVPEIFAGAGTVLRAVLLRRSWPLSELAALRVGATLDIPRRQIGRVRIEGSDGRFVGWAQLGQSGGHRALRISAGTDAPAPEPFDADHAPGTVTGPQEAREQLPALPSANLPSDLPAVPESVEPES